MKDSSNEASMKNLKTIVGIFFIFLGIISSRFVLEKFVSPYAIVELSYRIPLELISLSLIVLGFVIVFLKSSFLSLKKMGQYYKYSAITIVSSILLFIFFNGVLYGFSLLKDAAYYREQIFLGYRQELIPLYATLKESEIPKFLYETWSRPYVYEPYTQFKERACKGKYVNVSENGFRVTKNQGPWPPDPKNLNIFLFGGSTTFNYGVPDNETIASYLQELCGNQNSKKNAYIYNFGRGHYFSSQERILFEKLITSGVKPDVAIFIDGLNDFYYYSDEPLFTENLRKFMEDKGTDLLSLPLLSAIKNFKKGHEGEAKIKGAVSSESEYNDLPMIRTVVERYVMNKKIIELIGEHFNVKTFFIWQPVPTYKYDLKYHIFAGKGFGRFMYSKYGYAYMEDFIKKHNMGNDFLWLADIQENMKKPLYIDIDHYSPEMSHEIAKYVYNFLVTKNVFYTKG